MTNSSKQTSLLRNLNSVQKQAVTQIDGPNLILAGAGSGKTRVLTHKIAYLIAKANIKPQNILAVTFTNKAANEMKSRVAKLLNNQVKGMWIGTFHSNFARILRKNSDKLGFTSAFSIYDESDQLAVIKTVIHDLNYHLDKSISPKAIQSKIKLIKNSGIDFNQLHNYHSNNQLDNIKNIYQHYNLRMQQNNAMDFEDLLLKSIELFRLFNSVLVYYQNQFNYILVDEFQDTNRLQYELIKLLSAKQKNISVVGDDDQSIYRWRGADIRNILDFEKDFPNCHIFRLEQNYRSTSNILRIAHSIISHNNNRMKKELWTQQENGPKITLKIANTSADEANFIVNTIIDESHKHQRNFSDFAVLYRINAQSRAIEDVFKNNNIPYVIVGGIRFYERKEIKDVLAYLRVLINPDDSISLKRIINYPTRGIGQTSIEQIDNYSYKKNLTFYQSIQQIDKIETISLKRQATIKDFYQLIEKYRKLKATLPIGELITTLVEKLGIFRMLKEEGTPTSLSKIENIRELIFSINEFIKQNPSMSLEHYLENVALVSDVDNWDKTANAVSLLTLHSAKGLEFPVVFISGLEEGLFPLSRQMANEEDLEEERRLFYVGATRAQQKLYISAAKFRQRYGNNTNSAVSRFINEVDHDVLEIDKTADTWHANSRTNRPKKRVISFNDQNSDKKKLEPGILIKHPRFGFGVIRKIDGEKSNPKAYIIFEELGEKKILLNYTNLEIIS